MDLAAKMLSDSWTSWLATMKGVAARQHDLAATMTAEMIKACQPDYNPQHLFARHTELARNMVEASVANTSDLMELTHKLGRDAINIGEEHVRLSAGNWLANPENTTRLADFAVRKMPMILQGLDESGLPSFVGGRIRAELKNVEIARLVVAVSNGLVENQHTQLLLNSLLDGLQRVLSNSETMEIVRQKIRSKLPSLFNLYQGEPVVMNKIVDAALALISEIRTNAAHPLRAELDAYVTSFSERLHGSSEAARKLDGLMRDLLERPELEGLARNAWSGLRDDLTHEVTSENSQLRRRLEEMLVKVGIQLKQYSALD